MCSVAPQSGGPKATFPETNEIRNTTTCYCSSIVSKGRWEAKKGETMEACEPVSLVETAVNSKEALSGPRQKVRAEAQGRIVY